MSLITILLVIIFLLILYGITVSYLYIKKKNEQERTEIGLDMDYRLDEIKYRLKKIRKETPNYIELNLKKDGK